MTNESQSIKEMGEFLIELAIQEGNRFRQENGRNPTDAETERIFSMIQRQFQTALVLSKGASQ